MFWLAIIGAIILVAGGFVDNNMIAAGGALLIIALMVSLRELSHAIRRQRLQGR